jgi:Fic family protein
MELSHDAEIYPGTLNAVDRELIEQQLINQEAETVEEKENFTRAYQKAKELAGTTALHEITDEQVAELILEFARQVYPLENHFGLRVLQPVHGKTGEVIGVPPGRALEVAIVQWCEAYAAAQKSPDELFYEFEAIHPFNDGNGRVGHLMWALAMVRGGSQWPTTLPPEFSELKKKYSN